MFRSSTILRELVQSLANVTLLLKHSVKLRHCILCEDVAAWREMACVLFVVQNDQNLKICTVLRILFLNLKPLRFYLCNEKIGDNVN